VRGGTNRDPDIYKKISPNQTIAGIVGTFVDRLLG